MKTSYFLMASLLALGMASLARADEWPQFRGPDGAGVSTDKSPPIEWSSAKNISWKVKVPGYGWSCPVVWGQRVFVTTAVTDKQPAPARKGPGGGEPKPPDAVFRWEVHCLDSVTGQTLWQRVAAEHKPTLGNHISNTFASETPVTDGERVYAYFGMAGLLHCYTVAGEPVWEKTLGPYRTFANWGSSSSPALDGERLFVQCDNEEKSFLVAFNVKTGNELWRVSRPERSTWSSPVVWRNVLRTELVLMGSKRIRSYDPANGKLLWELATDEGGGGGASTKDGGKGGPTPKGGGTGGPPGKGGGKAAAGGFKSTPVATRDMIYVGMASKNHGQELGPMWAVKAGASGDLSLKPGETSNAHVAWYRPDAGPHFASAVVYDGLLYVFPPHDGTLRSFDAKTGADVYQKKLSGAREFKSSPWVCDGKIFNVDENGATYVVQAGREFEQLAKNDINEMCWSSPAPSGGALYLRAAEYLYCIKTAEQQK